MSDWNEQASRNNNIQPDITFKKEKLVEKKIQYDVQEEFDMDAEETDIKPKRKG